MLISPEQASAILGFQVDTLRAWRREGRGPNFFRFGRQIRYSVEEIERFAARCRVGQREELQPGPTQTLSEDAAMRPGSS